MLIVTIFCNRIDFQCFLFFLVQPYTNQSSAFPGPFDTSSNSNKIEEAVDPFSPRVQKFDPFEDKFAKPSSTFDFSFTKGMVFEKHFFHFFE